MRNTNFFAIAALLAFAAAALYAAQDSSLSIRQVRDPVQLRTALNANALDAQTRIAVLETSIGTNAAGQVVSVGALTVTGAVTIAEGALTDSKVVSADIKDGELVNADINASAAIAVTKLGAGGVIPANSAASLTNIPAANLSGNVPLAALTNAVTATILPAYASGTFQITDTTQLVYIASGVTNVIDADITH